MAARHEAWVFLKRAHVERTTRASTGRAGDVRLGLAWNGVTH